ncbi:MAG: bile acid:sodium symporter family protein [Alphaproteobacteria bacterium]|nr:MAG: bile acid:sodium symporter family protein [Alphaproteobacteria bacterium]
MNILTAWLIPAVVMVVMFSMGLALHPNDFLEVVRKPRAFAAGLAAQMLILPVLGFLVAYLTDPDPRLAVGLVIIAACPGGPMSNLLTHLARADTALSISLTATTSLLSIFTIPLLVAAALALFIGREAGEISVADTVLGVSAMTLVPVSLGMGLALVRPHLAERIEPWARRGALILFIALVIGAIAIDWDRVVEHFPTVAPLVVLLNLAAMVAAYTLSQVTRLAPERAIAVTIECGIQNGSLAMFVGATLLGDDVMMLPGAAYGVLMFPTALAFIAWVVRRERAKQPSRPALEENP